MNPAAEQHHVVDVKSETMHTPHAKRSKRLPAVVVVVCCLVAIIGGVSLGFHVVAWPPVTPPGGGTSFGAQVGLATGEAHQPGSLMTRSPSRPTPAPRPTPPPRRPAASGGFSTHVSTSMPRAVKLVPAIPCAYATPGTRLEFIGDSLTGGWYTSTPAQDYVSLVNSCLHATLIAQGWYGVSAAQTLRQFQQALPPRGDVVVLELGTNDLNLEGVQAFRHIYSHMLALLRNASPHARLVCLGTWRGPEGRAYDTAIAGACAHNGGTYRPLSDLYEHWSLRGPAGRTTWRGLADGFHPNVAGHRAIAIRVLQALGE
jgi:lysophospholipase L1-like esterase